MNHVVAAMARRSVSVFWRLVLAGVVASVIFIHVGLAQASDEKSGTHWLRKCTNPEPVWQIECAIYVQAVVEYDEVRANMLGNKQYICPEKETTIRQSREVVIKFLCERPQDLHRPFALLAHLALENAFPCAA
jgi:Rap1a immunity proteins